MLRDYQNAFYNMMVKGDQGNLEYYVGSTLPWQFQVYQNNYANSLLSSLNKTYRRFKTVVSSDISQDIFLDYITENPSAHQNLSGYGLDLFTWLKTKSGQYRMPEYAADIAHLDALLHLSYYQSNTPEFDANHFSHLTDQQKIEAKFYRLHSIYTLKSHWDFDDVMGSDCDNIRSHPFEFYYVIYRNQGVPTWQKVSLVLYELMCVLATPISIEKMSSDDRLNVHEHLPYLIKKSWVTCL